MDNVLLTNVEPNHIRDELREELRQQIVTSVADFKQLLKERIKQMEQRHREEIEKMEKRYQVEKSHLELIKIHEKLKTQSDVQHNQMKNDTFTAPFTDVHDEKIMLLRLRGEIKKEMKAIHAIEMDKIHGELRETQQRYQLEIGTMGKRYQDLEKSHQELLIKFYEDLKAQLEDQHKKLVSVNAAHSGKIAFSEESFQFKKDKFVGKWGWMECSNNLNVYDKHFGYGYFRWITGLYIKIEIDGTKLNLSDLDSRQKRLSTSHEFVFGEEFEWINDNDYKYKVQINIDRGKLIGKETSSGGKVSNGEMFIDSDGNLMITMESGGVKHIEKFAKIYE